MNLSTGAGSHLLAPIAAAFTGGCIFVYANGQPATPNDSDAGATLLGKITLNGLPWAFGSSTSGLGFITASQFLLSDPSQSWVLTPAVSGTAVWFRLYSADPAETGASSYTLQRLDGTIQPVGSSTLADAYLEDTSLIAGQPIDIASFVLTFPPIL